MLSRCWLYNYIILCLLVSGNPLAAQITTKSHRIDRELQFTFDNDMYFGTDRYYSYGININYAKVLNYNTNLYNFLRSKRSDTLKVVYGVLYGHQVHTPQKINTKNLAKIDRPYAGWHFITLEAKNYPSVNSSNKLGLEVGLIGEHSGIGNFHRWWHSNLGIKSPDGWDYQLDNKVIVNLKYNRDALLRISKLISAYSNVGLSAGNGLNAVSQEVHLRFGKYNRLFNSDVSKSRVSKHIPVVNNTDKEEEEGYFFYGIEGKYVMHNILLAGSYGGQENQSNPPVESFIVIRKWGFLYSNYYTSFSFTVYNISPEIKGNHHQRYISLNLTFRF